MTPTIQLAESEAAVSRCFPVMVQLRTHLTLERFVTQAQRQMQQERYRLAYLEDEQLVKAVAGFRFMEVLYAGKILYVDDLITDGQSRSRNYGGLLMDWLTSYAKAHDCEQLHLDSGVQRFDAHRFYFRKRMVISSYHFILKLKS